MEKLIEKITELIKNGIIPEDAVQALIDEYEPIIKVDRSVIAYPNFVKETLYREFEKIGPAEIDVSKSEQWLHPTQKNGVVEGNFIHDYLKRSNLLKGCYGFVELLAIQSKGSGFFRKYFAGKQVFGWKGIFFLGDENLAVPCLYIDCFGKVKLDFNWLDFRFHSEQPALRRAS